MNYEDRVTKEYVEGLLSGKAQCAVGSYVGDGKSGPSNPTTITFPFTPKLVLVFTSTTTPLTGQTLPFWTFFWDYTTTTAYGNYKSAVSYNGNTLSVYYNAENVGIYQMNHTGDVYTWLAIG